MTLKQVYYDLAIIWEWDYDRVFNDMLKNLSLQKNISVIFIDLLNLEEVSLKIKNQSIYVKWFLDRASESDKRFIPFIELLLKYKTRPINHPSHVYKALNKSYMHQYLSNYNLPLPETIIIPSFKKNSDIPFFTLEQIGIPFVVKPSNGGGGDGVYMNVIEIAQVEEYRKEFPDQEYLIQQMVVPQVINQEPMWFRVYYVGKSVFITLWNPSTKIFRLLKEDELKDNNFRKCEIIAAKIASLSKLKLFSTEIAIQHNGELLIIDYVNDPIDLRTKSFHPDGIPDKLVEQIILALIAFLKNNN